MEVLHPKKLETHPGDSIVSWARGQLEIAREILDNPGGGLLSATQTIGQVSSALRERDLARWEDVVAELERIEDAAVRREFDTARNRLDQVLAKLP
ncbi:MAG TPA: hypothetical protein VKF16_01210 [Candidatus Dormibacteraeota bacterium]|nr:hypothetical protein [Candidatus Dormibacteraeota bacterium]